MCRWLVLSVLTISLGLPAVRLEAQAPQPRSATYTWSGQLIALDIDARSITVKAPVRGDQAHTELSQFTPGDRILLTWSGYGARADAIFRAVRFNPASDLIEPFTFPAEFVKYEPGIQYLTFIVGVPDTNFDTIKALRPGAWVTSTVRERMANESETIAAVTP